MLGVNAIGGPVFYAILLMMVAAFLALRLYSVLGKRTGEPLPRAAEERVGAQPLPRTVDVTPEVRDVQAKPIDSAPKAGSARSSARSRRSTCRSSSRARRRPIA